jgi:hypothetical protein
MVSIILSLNFCHQILLWLAGIHASTVNIAFKSKTHCDARDVKSQLIQFFIIIDSFQVSDFISLNIFFKLGGGLIQDLTEKQSQ